MICFRSWCSIYPPALPCNGWIQYTSGSTCLPSSRNKRKTFTADLKGGSESINQWLSEYMPSFSHRQEENLSLRPQWRLRVSKSVALEENVHLYEKPFLIGGSKSINQWSGAAFALPFSETKGHYFLIGSDSINQWFEEHLLSSYQRQRLEVNENVTYSSVGIGQKETIFSIF